jgi:hypothetical protein
MKKEIFINKRFPVGDQDFTRWCLHEHNDGFYFNTTKSVRTSLCAPQYMIFKYELLINVTYSYQEIYFEKIKTAYEEIIDNYFPQNVEFSLQAGPYLSLRFNDSDTAALLALVAT